MSIKTIHVTSGDFVVKGSEHVKLQAFLGTCLGIGIIDRKNKVAGLIHILLSEPVSNHYLEFPLKYASTGIPVFIEELINKGAEISEMKTCIAGGALVGPLSEQDMAMDIGGRTADVAVEVLKKHGINVDYSETGGFFSCCLEINLKNLTCSIKPIEDDEDEVKKDNFSPPDIKNIIEKLNTLKPIPQVALKILRLVNAEDYNIKTIAQEVRKDQVISAKIIQLCNSSFFSVRRKVESIDDAIIILGLNQLVKIVITSSIKDYFSRGALGYSLCKGGLFHHAVGSAAIAEAIAIKTKLVPSGIAYTAGLLHDIGIVVLDQFAKGIKPYFYRELKRDKRILLIEKNLFGLTHVDIGEELANRWNFTDLLIDVIKFHHNPDMADNNRDIVNIIYISDIIMTRFNQGVNIGEIDTGDFEKNLSEIGLTLDQLPELVDLIPTGDAFKIIKQGIKYDKFK